jgi:hypothetical protein
MFWRKQRESAMQTDIRKSETGGNTAYLNVGHVAYYGDASDSKAA